MNKVKVILIAILLSCFICSVDAGGDYEISWSTIDGGGGSSSGGEYALVGTIGQADAGEMSGGDYRVHGGFWVGGPILFCFVNFEDFAEFAKHWLDTPCNAGNDWCGGADLDYSGSVGLSDIRDLAYFWLCACPEDWPWD